MSCVINCIKHGSTSSSCLTVFFFVTFFFGVVGEGVVCRAGVDSDGLKNDKTIAVRGEVRMRDKR